MKHLHRNNLHGLSGHLLTIISATALLFATLSITSCSKKPKQDPNKSYQELQADAITSIKASKAITVKFIQQEGTPQITVISKKAYTDQIDVHMEGSILVATYKPNAEIAESGVEVVVQAPAINEIEADMAAIVNLGDKLELTGDLRIKCNHAGSVKGKKVKCNNLLIETDNASVVQLSSLTANDITATATRASTIVLEGKTNNCLFKQAAENQIIHDKLNTKNGSTQTIAEPVDPAEVKKPATQQKPATTQAPAAQQKPAAKSDSAKTETKKP